MKFRQILILSALATMGAPAQYDLSSSSGRDPFGNSGSSSSGISDSIIDLSSLSAEEIDDATIQMILESGIDTSRLPAEIRNKLKKDNRPAPKTPQERAQRDAEKQRTQLLQRIQIDRSTAGILDARLRAKRLANRKADEDKQPKPPAPNPEPNNNGNNEGKEGEKPKFDQRKETQRLVKQYKQDVEVFKTAVTLGEWEKVSKFFASLTDREASQTFNLIVQQLSQQGRSSSSSRSSGSSRKKQEPYVRPNEILTLSDCAKKELSNSNISKLASLISPSNRPPEDFFAKLHQGTKYFGKDTEEKKARTAQFLLSAGFLDDAAGFLPDLKEATKNNKHTFLNLLGKFHLASYKAGKGQENLPKAWGICINLVSNKDAHFLQRNEALYRALEIVPELEGSTGSDWISKTFKDPSGEGYEILAAVATSTAQNRDNYASDPRLDQIQLQSSSAEALLASPNLDVKPWKELLTLFARNWIYEAKRSYKLDDSGSMRPQMDYDDFGNPYYRSTRNREWDYRSGTQQPINSGDLLRARPSDSWSQNVDEAIRLELLSWTTRLLLKVKEQELSMPLIRELAKVRPEEAKKLVSEMIQVWAENNNPNRQDRYRSSYYYYYGYNSRAETIPLTRSKQERNLKKLAELYRSVQDLKLGKNFQVEFAGAFIQAHSKAEVWRLEALSQVFGSLDELDPETVNALVARMRQNLAGLWPNPKVQKQAKTKRTDKELKAQVLRGYQAAINFTSDTLARNPDSWLLQLQLASLTYEASNYKSTLASNPDHALTKSQCLVDIAKSAATYTSTLPLKKKSDESIEPFATWFFAALGSPNLGGLKADHQPVHREFAKIKEALEAIPAECRERHLDQFTRTLNARLANVSADLKYRYLENALPITGEHPRIEEASKVFQYYQDLITEIILDVKIDGPDQINHATPFGLFVNLRHTKEIERESGGFQRYLINQNNQPYSYNYGRPTEDYRDKFEKAARTALEEHFEVISLTFHKSKVKSRSTQEHGWTETPYAYFLLKAKGPEVDTIPPLKMDLDFLDTSGYVVLPVSSSSIPIDASKPTSPRPYRNLSLSQILDERESHQNGKVVLELKATAHGLIPALDQLIKLPIHGFEITETEDRELQVEELDAETDDGAPLSTHEWRLTLTPTTKNLPRYFSFPEVIADLSTEKEKGLTLQKYQDVDLVSVETRTPITAGKDSASPWLLLLLLVPIALIAFAAWFIFFRKKDTEEAIITGPPIPNTLTPVTVLSYLESLTQSPLAEEQKSSLQTAIAELKDKAFGPAAKPPAEEDLQSLATHWQGAAHS